MIETKEVVWEGTSEKCQLCGTDLGTVMYDVRLPTYGSWANVGDCCFRAHGCQLGTGHGQKYVLRKPQGGTEPRWVKVAG